MSSVSIISGVAARMKHLIHEQELTDSQRLVLMEMENIIKSLKAADEETKESKQFVRMELLIVQLSYDIADAVEQRMILPKQRARFSNIFRRNPPVEPDLESLTSILVNMKKTLECVHVIKKKGGRDMNMNMNMKEDVMRAGAVEMEVREALRSSAAVIFIYGGRGMGKTTLARKVFDEARAGTGEYSYSFRGFAWVRVKQECEPRKVFEDILQQLSLSLGRKRRKADIIRDMDEIEMIQQILMIQKENKCLLVLEDVWELQDWNSIRVALLIGRTTKTLITTPSWEVAQMAKSRAKLCTIKPLHQQQISSILKDKANFHHHELDVYGEIISSLSQGSPLFALVLGKCFKTADEIGRDQLIDECEKNRNREKKRNALDACYHVLLPDELKPCLIYMGQFPKGQDIDVEKLQLLLEAEGILSSPEDSGTRNNISLQSARDILEKLANRKLVKLQEDKASTTRMYKSCQLHDLIRNFCILKGLEEELFEIVDFGRPKKIAASTRRLAIYLSNYKDGDAITFSREDKGKKIRSLLIFGALGSLISPHRKSTWPSEINDFKEFSSLRVLDFDRVDFRVGKVLRGMDKLVFLRYLGFRGCWLEAFPSSITKLLFLETLDLRLHDDCTMIISNSIVLSNLKRLRNLYFPLRYRTEQGITKLRLHGLEMLEILVNFRIGVCDVDDLSQLRNLRILATISEAGNHSDLAAVVEYSYKTTNLQQSSFIITNFNCYSTDKIAVFIKRLLECHTLQSLRIQGRIEKLPQELAISPNLSEIIFDGSEFDDSTYLNVLRSLKNVRSLVLSNNAFVGEGLSIAFARKYFPNLRTLKLLNLQNLQKLAFHRGSMPKLSTLVVENCENLKQFTMPKALETRLQVAERNKVDDVYSVELTPTTN